MSYRYSTKSNKGRSRRSKSCSTSRSSQGFRSSQRTRSSKSSQKSKLSKPQYLAGRAGIKRSSRVRKSRRSEELFNQRGYDSSYFRKPIIGHIPKTRDEKELELA